MEKFIITQNNFLSKDIQAYYRYDYTKYGTEGNPDFINHLKNQFRNTSESILKNAVYKLTKVLQEDLPKIYSLHNTNLTVCEYHGQRLKVTTLKIRNYSKKWFQTLLTNLVDLKMEQAISFVMSIQGQLI